MSSRQPHGHFWAGIQPPPHLRGRRGCPGALASSLGRRKRRRKKSAPTAPPHSKRQLSTTAPCPAAQTSKHGGAAERGRGREGDRRLPRGDRVTGSATRRPHRSCHIHTLSKGSAGTKPCYLPRARLRRLRQPGPSSKAAMEIGRFPPQILSFLERSLPIKGTYCRITVQTQAT